MKGNLNRSVIFLFPICTIIFFEITFITSTSAQTNLKESIVESDSLKRRDRSGLYEKPEIPLVLTPIEKEMVSDSTVLSPVDSTILYDLKCIAFTRQWMLSKVKVKLTGNKIKVTTCLDAKKVNTTEVYFRGIMERNLKIYGRYEVLPTDQGIRIPLDAIFDLFR